MSYGPWWHATDILGYTADAGAWCPECRQDVYGTADCDSEGNPIHPVFVSDEGSDTLTCDRCNSLLMGG